MVRILALLALFIGLAANAAGEKSYSSTLPKVGLQRNPAVIKTSFNEVLSWINDLYADTDNGANTNAALLTDGNGSFFLNDVIRSTVPINHTGGNGTNGQLMASSGSGTTKWVSTGPLTTGDKYDIYVANGSNQWELSNLAIIRSFNGATADNKFSGGMSSSESLLNGKLLTQRSNTIKDLPALSNGDTYEFESIGYFRSTTSGDLRLIMKVGSVAVVDTGFKAGPGGTNSGTIKLYSIFTKVASNKTIGNGFIEVALSNGKLLRYGTSTQTVVNGVTLDGTADLDVTWESGSDASAIYHFTNSVLRRVY